MNPEPKNGTGGATWRRYVEALWSFVDGGGIKLPGSVVRVFFVLLRHADRETGESRPSRRRIANLADLDPRSVPRALAALEAAGFIERINGGGRDSLVCRVLLPLSEGVTTRSPVTALSPGGDSPVTSEVTVVSPLRSRPGHPEQKRRGTGEEEQEKRTEGERLLSPEAIEARLHLELCRLFDVRPAHPADRSETAKQSRSDHTTLGKIARYITNGRSPEQARAESGEALTEAKRIIEEKRRDGRGRRLATFTNRMKARYPGLFNRNGTTARPHWEGARR